MFLHSLLMLFLFLLSSLSARVSVSPGQDLAAVCATESAVTLLSGEHVLQETLVVNRDLTIFFANGATLSGDLPKLIQLESGLLILEGLGKPGKLLNTAGFGERGHSSVKRKSILDLNSAVAGSPPELVVRNMQFHAYNGIDGYYKDENKNALGAVQIENSAFFCSEKAIGFIVPSLASMRVENCQFDGADMCLFVDCPIPGGVIVRGNVLRDFGRRGMQLGKGGQVADGCTEHLPNAIVHDNQLLGGGQRATLNDSYIHGILIYGHNVSVQGNIVRDVYRGQPVPGEIGQVMLAEDGQELSGIRVDTEAAKHRRLAGAAIYLKANRALVQGNVCTNSGWRSVIEIKTGGKEHFVSVVNNVVDGRSLARDESFGFECNSGRSLWAGNLVYDMPNEAFVVRSGYENTFINNLIVNAKVGFALSGVVPGHGELVAGNRFVNVEYPVVQERNLLPAAGQAVHLPPPIRLDLETEVPDPGEEWLGRQILHGEKMLLGVQLADQSHRWVELTGKLLPRRQYSVIGPELALNPDQSATEPLGLDSLDNPLHRGWEMRMTSSNEKRLDPADGHVTYDQNNFRTGKQALKICLQGVSGNWQLRQGLSLQPGRRYRATAMVKGEEPLNLRLTALTSGGGGEQVRAVDTQEWQLLSLDFVTPANSGSTQLRVWSSKTNEGKTTWLDSVSVRELRQEELDEEGKVITRPVIVWQPIGPELALNPDQSSDDKLTPESLNKPEHRGWALSMTPQEGNLESQEYRLLEYDQQDFLSGNRALVVGFKQAGGNLLLTQPLQLQAGKKYRATATLKSKVPKQVILGVKTADQKSFSATPEINTGWQTQMVDFAVTAPEGKTNIRIWAGNLPPGEKILIDAISVRELQEVPNEP